MNLKEKKLLGFKSKAIHCGGEPDPSTNAIMPPIFQTSTYVQSNVGEHKGYEYTRSHNPTRTRLEEALAALENAQYALVTSSGMSAIMLIMHTLPKDSTILCSDDVYGGTYRLFSTVFNDKYNVHFIDTTNIKAVENKIKELRPNLFWLESPSNPLLKITAIKKITALTKKFKCLTLVDNTFMSPYFQNPLDLGADMVMHSMTKYINGHSDVVGGCIMLNNKKLYEKIWSLHNSIGPCLSPFDSWLVLRGLKTLALRMEAHQTNAMALAKWLEKHSSIEKVIYPGLSSHPQHKIAKKQMSGYSGIITILLKGDLKKSKQFLKKLKVFSLAESLGGVESLINHPAIMTHSSIPKKVRESLGIFNNLIRCSVGIEDLSDLKQDIEQALK